MLVTRQKIFGRFWYPVIPMDQLADGPKPFTLLCEKIVLWLDADGKPAATIDRCGHRTAKLSCGFVENGHLVCGYHGWTYDRAGNCVRVPQAKDPARTVNFKLDAYRCVERYGYAWSHSRTRSPTFRRFPRPTTRRSGVSPSSMKSGGAPVCASWRTHSTPRTSPSSIATASATSTSRNPSIGTSTSTHGASAL